MYETALVYQNGPWRQTPRDVAARKAFLANPVKKSRGHTIMKPNSLSQNIQPLGILEPSPYAYPSIITSAYIDELYTPVRKVASRNSLKRVKSTTRPEDQPIESDEDDSKKDLPEDVHMAITSEIERKDKEKRALVQFNNAAAFAHVKRTEAHRNPELPFKPIVLPRRRKGIRVYKTNNTVVGMQEIQNDAPKITTAQIIQQTKDFEKSRVPAARRHSNARSDVSMRSASNLVLDTASRRGSDVSMLGSGSSNAMSIDGSRKGSNGSNAMSIDGSRKGRKGSNGSTLGSAGSSGTRRSLGGDVIME